MGAAGSMAPGKEQRTEETGMDYKKLCGIFPMIGGGVMVVWGLLANDWSKCWIAAVIGGILAGICGVLAKDGKDKKDGKKE